MIVVSDSNTLIGLAKGDVFSILRPLFGEIWTSGCVWEEVVEQGAGRAGADELCEARAQGWLRLREPALSAPTCDLAVLALAVELGATRLLTDDGGLAARAGQESVAVLNTAEVVFLGREQGLLPSCREVFDRMEARLRPHGSPPFWNPNERPRAPAALGRRGLRPGPFGLAQARCPIALCKIQCQLAHRIRLQPRRKFN